MDGATRVIYDCFMYYNEVDVLLMRLKELDPVVDKFVIVQGTHTFQGTPIPESEFASYLEDPRFFKYANKIVSVLVDLTGRFWNPWERETMQRNGISDKLKEMHLQPDDIVILSDADEIPRREVIEREIKSLNDIKELRLDAFFYYLNVKAEYQHTAKLFLYCDLYEAQTMRKTPGTKIVEDAGWHFSYIGDTDFIINKLKSYAHSEFNKTEIANAANIELAIKEQKAFWDGDTQFFIVEVDDTWPHDVVDNPEKWDRYIWKL